MRYNSDTCFSISDLGSLILSYSRCTRLQGSHLNIRHNWRLGLMPIVNRFFRGIPGRAGDCLTSLFFTAACLQQQHKAGMSWSYRSIVVSIVYALVFFVFAVSAMLFQTMSLAQSTIGTVNGRSATTSLASCSLPLTSPFPGKFVRQCSYISQRARSTYGWTIQDFSLHTHAVHLFPGHLESMGTLLPQSKARHRITRVRW